MSYPSIEIVKEFFTIHSFLVLEIEDILFVKNLKKEEGEIKNFVLKKEDIQKIKNAMVKPISWHTQKFTPSVLNKFPEIFDFLKMDFSEGIKEFLKNEKFLKILVIPALPSTENLRKQSIEIMKNKGLDNVILFPTVISALVEKINSRKVYLSFTNEILRILKFYDFFSEERELPFKGK